MLKLVVLCAVLVAVAAEPGALLATPFITQFRHSVVVAPATTTITKQASSIVHPSPYYYSSPLAYTHFIKKRSAPLTLATSYYAPATYFATPYLTPSYTAPIVHSTYVAPHPLTYTNALHLIKKRSVGYVLPSTYIAPTSYSTQSRVDVHSSPSYSFIAPLTYSSPLFTRFYYKK